jgi:hypothetical protein
MLHREDGPAIENEEEDIELWYLFNKKYPTKKAYNKALQDLKQSRLAQDPTFKPEEHMDDIVADLLGG